MEEEKKESESAPVSVSMPENSPKTPGITDKIRKNPWILASLVLGAVVVILLIGTFSGGLTGKVISADQIGEKLLEFYTENGAEGLTLDSVSEVSGVYEVNFLYNGGIVPVYVTKDGTLVGSLSQVDLSSNSSSSTAAEVPKSDKPSVELYVFTYCPYGLQMEKAVLPAIELLGSKVDFKIRQIGAMHGEYEEVEAVRQLSIEALYPDKFLDYVLAFAEDTSIGNCNGDAACLTPLLNALYTKLGMDGAKINAYMTSNGQDLYDAEVENANAGGVSGSPTFLINGVTVQVSRDPESVKGAICNAFNNVPSECSQTLSTESPSAGFGSGTGSTTSASC